MATFPSELRSSGDRLTMRVKATREGLIGKGTSSGYIIERIVPFVALPSTHALFRVGLITNPRTGKSCTFIVLDVGPWNEHDDAYVLGGERPQAESGTDMFDRPTNGAGIDLSEAVWKKLGMVDNDEVEWTFYAETIPAPTHPQTL